MLTPGFWSSRHPSPDKVVMSPDQIEGFNAKIRKTRGSVSYMPNLTGTISGKTVRYGIEAGLKLVKGMRLYDANGEVVSNSVWPAIEANCNLRALPKSIRIRTAFPSVFADQRLVPSEVNFNKKPLDYEFDELQNSGYDIGTPLVIYHTSSDGNWVYGSSAVTSGWFRTSQLCFVEDTIFKDYQSTLDYIVLTNARADVWQDSLRTIYSGFARMGSRFPLLEENDQFYVISLPVRDGQGSRMAKGYVLKNDAHKGYLPFTARNVYELAFRMLNRPYGWADINGNTDCSSYLRQLFSCFGIVLPRNSAEQRKSAKTLYTFSSGETPLKRNENLMKYGKPGITILQRPGHITLYLGSFDGRGYIIHNTWAERKKNSGYKDDIYLIDRVVVSDVFIGNSSTSGPMIKHFTTVSSLEM